MAGGVFTQAELLAPLRGLIRMADGSPQLTLWATDLPLLRS